MNKRRNEQTNEQTIERTNERMNERTHLERQSFEASLGQMDRTNCLQLVSEDAGGHSGKYLIYL